MVVFENTLVIDCLCYGKPQFLEINIVEAWMIQIVPKRPNHHAQNIDIFQVFSHLSLSHYDVTGVHYVESMREVVERHSLHSPRYCPHKIFQFVYRNFKLVNET